MTSRTFVGATFYFLSHEQIRIDNNSEDEKNILHKYDWMIETDQIGDKDIVCATI
jgi:hypothetical protein